MPTPLTFENISQAHPHAERAANFLKSQPPLTFENISQANMDDERPHDESSGAEGRM